MDTDFIQWSWTFKTAVRPLVKRPLVPNCLFKFCQAAPNGTLVEISPSTCLIIIFIRAMNYSPGKTVKISKYTISLNVKESAKFLDLPPDVVLTQNAMGSCLARVPSFNRVLWKSVSTDSVETVTSIVEVISEIYKSSSFPDCPLRESSVCRGSYICNAKWVQLGNRSSTITRQGGMPERNSLCIVKPPERSYCWWKGLSVSALWTARCHHWGRPHWGPFSMCCFVLALHIALWPGWPCPAFWEPDTDMRSRAEEKKEKPSLLCWGLWALLPE